jgi:hypothetical protein
MRTKWLGLSAVVALLGIASHASAGAFVADYFEVQNSGTNLTGPTTGDFGFCCSSPPATLEVIGLGSGLGPTGMPVAGPGSTVFDLNSANEILWWTNGADGIAATGSGPFKLGVLNNMFAPNSTGSTDAGWFETAIVSGSMTGDGGNAKIAVSSDDDALVYVNGLYVGGLPGVHGTESTTINLGTLAPGVTDSVEVFYADRARVGANLLVGVSVPEPATWAMMLVGVGMIGGGLRMARRKTDVALTAA